MPDRPSDQPPRQDPFDVLVVDHDGDSAEAIAAVLRVRGCAVRLAPDVTSALEAIGRHPPEIIVTDLMLGGALAGSAIAQTIRSDPRTCDIALVAVSRDVDPEWDVVAAFDAYLRKPVDLKLLLKLVPQLVEQVRARRAKAVP